MSEYKGNITLPSYAEYCENLLSDAVKTNKKIKCQNCEGHGTVAEDLESSQGNWHEVEEDCEQCNGEGEVDACESDKSNGIVSVYDYKQEMIETVRKLSSWTNSDFFLNICKCKGLFNGGLING